MHLNMLPKTEENREKEMEEDVTKGEENFQDEHQLFNLSHELLLDILVKFPPFHQVFSDTFSS